MKCNYRFCAADIPLGLNGHSRYCNHDCSYAERLEREKDKNAANKKAMSEIRRIESLLRVCYTRYGEAPFDIQLLRAMKMNWTLYSGTADLAGIMFRVVNSFGYVAMDDGTIKIIKF